MPKNEKYNTLAELHTYIKNLEAQWKLENPNSGRPSFWELCIEPDLVDFVSLSSEVASRVTRGSRRDAEAVSMFLFCLLQGQATYVSGNRLWPEVARVLRSLGGSIPDDAQTAEYFRKRLRQVYPRELHASEYRTKYLHLCFEETGIGENRPRYIREFFEWLISGSKTVGDDIQRIVDQAFDEYLKLPGTQNEVEPLHLCWKKNSAPALECGCECRRSTISGKRDKTPLRIPIKE